MKNMKVQESAVKALIDKVYQPNEQSTVSQYKTVNQFSFDNPCFTTSSLRNLIFKAHKRQSSNGVIPGNGLLETGAIIRIGRKVLINGAKFFDWIESQNIGGAE